MPDKILVIEDNPITCRSLETTLTREGFEVQAVHLGRNVEQLLQTAPPDLILLDLVLPDSSGLEVLARIRATAGLADLPVLAMSESSDQNGHLAAGFTDHLVKPLDTAQLASRIRMHLRPRPGARPGAPRVIVIDDNAVQRKLTQLCISALGLDVVTAEEAFEGLALARANPPDLIVSDIMMPGVDGFQLCRAVRMDPELASIPVMLASSRQLDRDDHELGVRAGASALIMRTPDLAELTAAIRDRLAMPAIGRAITRPELPNQAHREVIAELERQADRDARMACAAQVWEAILSILERISALSAAPCDPATYVDDILASMLDASGFSRGAIYSYERGEFELRSVLGWSRSEAPTLAGLFGSIDLLHRASDGRAPVALDRACVSQTAQQLLAQADIGSMLVVPLRWRDTALGSIVLASLNTELARDWLVLARAVAGPIAQAIMLLRLGGQAAASSAVDQPTEPAATPSAPSAPSVPSVPSAPSAPSASAPSVAPPRTDLDALTGLLGRVRFHETLDGRLSEARRYGTHGALLLIDLDRMSWINELFGRAMGDAALRALGDILVANTRSSDIRARLGDDHFAVILLHARGATAERCAAKILDKLADAEIVHDGAKIRLSASIGVAAFPDHGTSPDDILTAADGALYRAKQAGGHQVCALSPDDIVARVCDLGDLAAPQRHDAL